jgi:hypothetical protein
MRIARGGGAVLLGLAVVLASGCHEDGILLAPEEPDRDYLCLPDPEDPVIVASTGDPLQTVSANCYWFPPPGHWVPPPDSEPPPPGGGGDALEPVHHG